MVAESAVDSYALLELQNPTLSVGADQRRPIGVSGVLPRVRELMFPFPK